MKEDFTILSNSYTFHYPLPLALHAVVRTHFIAIFDPLPPTPTPACSSSYVHTYNHI